MANFNCNKVILGGRLTADPELKTTQSGLGSILQRSGKPQDQTGRGAEDRFLQRDRLESNRRFRIKVFP